LQKISVESAKSNFYKAYREISEFAGDQKIYLENNVITEANLIRSSYNNPFMFTDYNGYHEMTKNINFPVLLDIAHLKVSSNTLKKDFEKELGNLINKSNYLHLSDNDGIIDQNLPISEKSDLYELLKKKKLKNKTITLEIYDNIDKIKESYYLINKLVN